MVRYGAAVSLLALTACAAPLPPRTTAPVAVPDPAPTVNPRSAKERFVAAVEAKGCVMPAQNLRAIKDQATVETGDIRSIVPALQAEGRATVDGPNIRVITDTCVA